MIRDKNILIIGGSGSLGNALIRRYLETNRLTILSRDECKHWSMQLQYQSDSLRFIMGDIRNKRKMTQVLSEIQPQVIIIAAALKHIDKCESDTHECVETNLNGTLNVVDSILELRDGVLETVCFVSTDKACSPVNTYGMSKAISENYMIEASARAPEFKFVIVRYGNVLNSRGSIIPILHAIGRDASREFFSLTDPAMTRFVMTLDQSVDLIDHAITEARSGYIVIPRLVSMKVVDLLSIFSDLYGKPVVETGLRPGEKILESLINDTQSKRLEHHPSGDFMYIKPCYLTTREDMKRNPPHDYNSLLNPMTREELQSFLDGLGLLSSDCSLL